MSLDSFTNLKITEKLEVLSYKNLPLVLAIVKMKGPVTIHGVWRIAVLDLGIRNLVDKQSSIRQTFQIAENLGLVKRDSKTKDFTITEKGKDVTDWLFRVLQFLSQL